MLDESFDFDTGFSLNSCLLLCWATATNRGTYSTFQNNAIFFIKKANLEIQICIKEMLLFKVCNYSNRSDYDLVQNLLSKSKIISISLEFIIILCIKWLWNIKIYNNVHQHHPYRIMYRLQDQENRKKKDMHSLIFIGFIFRFSWNSLIWEKSVSYPWKFDLVKIYNCCPEI